MISGNEDLLLKRLAESKSAQPGYIAPCSVHNALDIHVPVNQA